ncbi:sugar phosphate isomerase/epimerase [Methanocella sp. CWC-04]|uniref:Sugar phosphate isomerase/epimerase n=1 Tax=Methanooceanicella nereidis TaxID=2052831 RepID=A0AAP2RCY0_9EURY|nr:sugar phosphate isomerase/epimerase [Methanocella sp. CWC-04]
MKVGFSAYKLVTYPFSWAYRLEDMGFQGWEIVSEAKQRISRETLPEIKDIINSTNLKITVHGPFSDLNCATLNDPIWNETIAQFKQCIELSADFSDTMVIHPGVLSPLGNQVPDKAWDRNIEALRIICDHAKDYGVKICLENMPNMDKLLCRTPHEIFGMIEMVGRENLGMTFDVGHANTVKNIPGFLKEKHRFSHIHAHDNRGAHDEHLQIGTGIIDWKYILKEIKDFDGVVVIEGRSLEEGEKSLEFIRDWEKNNQ